MENRLPRKLAAILYADVAGYSRLTGDDEDATHLLLREYLDFIAAAVGTAGVVEDEYCSTRLEDSLA